MYLDPYRMESTSAIASVVATAQDIAINGKPFMISNTGAQPLYINPTGTATSSSFLVPANTTLPIIFTCSGNLSVISNSTGTSVSVMLLTV